MKLTLYGNCQMDGVAFFVRKVHPAWDIRVHRNYQLMLGETAVQPLLDDVADCDVFIFQPTVAFDGKGGHVPSTDDLEKSCRAGAKRLSYAYLFNTGFFPICKSGRWWTGDKLVRWASELNNPKDLLVLWDCMSDKLWFDCARRFAENLAEQSRREIGCTIKMAPWILENFQTQHLFVLHNHPASALFVELAHRVLLLIDPALDGPMAFDHPNQANLPGYHGVHPAVVRELGLQYEPDRRGEDMEFYRALITELAATKGLL